MCFNIIKRIKQSSGSIVKHFIRISMALLSIAGNRMLFQEKTISRTPANITAAPTSRCFRLGSFKKKLPKKTEMSADILFIAIT